MGESCRPQQSAGKSLHSSRCITHAHLLICLCCIRLFGALPPEIGDLTGLTTVDLSGNSITGYLPSSWSTLQHIQTMYVLTQRSQSAVNAYSHMFSAEALQWP